MAMGMGTDSHRAGEQGPIPEMAPGWKDYLCVAAAAPWHWCQAPAQTLSTSSCNPIAVLGPQTTVTLLGLLMHQHPGTSNTSPSPRTARADPPTPQGRQHQPPRHHMGTHPTDTTGTQTLHTRCKHQPHRHNEDADPTHLKAPSPCTQQGHRPHMHEGHHPGLSSLLQPPTPRSPPNQQGAPRGWGCRGGGIICLFVC